MSEPRAAGGRLPSRSSKPMSDLTSPGESVSVAAFLVRRSREDRDALLEELVSLLSGAMPGVQVSRSLFRRRVKTVSLPIGDSVYVLARTGVSFEAARQHRVRGVVVRTIPMEIDAFLAELGAALDVELRRTDQGRNALTTWLNSANT